MNAAGVVDLGGGVFQLPTDYPSVCNAPLWSYLVQEDDHFALIDPGVRSTLSATLSTAIRSLNLDIENADLVMATHGHPDHSGGQHSWEVAAPTALIAAPLAEVPWIESFERQWVQFWDDYPGTMDLADERNNYEALCVPEPTVGLMLRDGDTVYLRGRPLHVVETRGHTWGHCAYFDETRGALFTGDAVQGSGTRSSDGTSTFSPMYVDVSETRQGLERLLAHPFDLLCPAHSSSMARDDGLHFLRVSLDFVDRAEEIARDLVATSGDSPVLTSELARRIGAFVGTRSPLSPQSVTTARAHLYSLAREGLLEAAWLPTIKRVN